MTDRIDYAAEAQGHIQNSRAWLSTDDYALADAELRAGHIKATLALVEQQRIANVIAAGMHEVNEPVPAIPGAKRLVLKPDVATALGVDR